MTTVKPKAADQGSLYQSELAAAKEIGGNLETKERAILAKLNSGKDLSPAELFGIQIEYDQAKRTSDAFSNLMKKISDTIDNVIRNFR